MAMHGCRQGRQPVAVLCVRAARAEAQGGERLKRGKDGLENLCTKMWGPGVQETAKQTALSQGPVRGSYLPYLPKAKPGLKTAIRNILRVYCLLFFFLIFMWMDFEMTVLSAITQKMGRTI